MDRIVSTGLKIDLHIHSCLSSHKDDSKVNNNTIENSNILIEALNRENVNIISITDHDAFDFNLYAKLKNEEESGSIKKVFPGIEFTVEYEKGVDPLHVIAIFNDSDMDKVKKISSVIELGTIENNRTQQKRNPTYDRGNCYSEENFLKILRKIDLDTILIVHQKGSLLSTNKPLEHDANSVSYDKFDEFIYTEYFEAFEFRNRKHEIFNKIYIKNHNRQEEMRLITSSDCHDWSVYPNFEKGKNEEFEFSWIKCLPTFKGLIMAMTDYRRIKRNNSFFSVSDKILTNIKIKTNNTEYSIPLSKGINVIIGDNSIGKSLLLHEITDTYIDPKKQKNGYKKYMDEQGFEVLTKLDHSNLFIFDWQSKIKNNFESGNLTNNDFLKDYYPPEIKTDAYKKIIEDEITKFCNAIDSFVKYNSEINNLTNLTLHISPVQSQTISILQDLTHDNNLDKEQEYKNASADLQSIIRNITAHTKTYSSILSEDDKKQLNNSIIEISKIEEKYKLIIKDTQRKKEIRNVIITKVNEKHSELQKIKKDTDKLNGAYETKRRLIINQFMNLKRNQSKLQIYNTNINEIQIKPQVENVYKYRFIRKIGIEKINNDYIQLIIDSFLNESGKKWEWNNLTVEEVKKGISRYPDNEDNWIQVIKDRAEKKYLLDLKCSSSILEKTELDLTKEMSAGKNMQTYFNLISFNTKDSGIYIVDQPEDSVAQKAIKDYVLDRFKEMSEHRQVIMVTHNPQFIVNLDVDNVIYISKVDEALSIKSGALEYEGLDEFGSEYKIIEIVATNIDGGIETINRRWKRYEKRIKL